MEVSEGQNNTDVWSSRSAETGGRENTVTVNTRAELVRKRCDTHTPNTHTRHVFSVTSYFSPCWGGGVGWDKWDTAVYKIAQLSAKNRLPEECWD